MSSHQLTLEGSEKGSRKETDHGSGHGVEGRIMVSHKVLLETNSIEVRRFTQTSHQEAFKDVSLKKARAVSVPQDRRTGSLRGASFTRGQWTVLLDRHSCELP